MIRLPGRAGNHAEQQFDGGRVYPLDVLDDDKDRPLARGGDKRFDEDLKGALALRGRSEVRRLVSRARGDRQYRPVVAQRGLEIGDRSLASSERSFANASSASSVSWMPVARVSRSISGASGVLTWNGEHCSDRISRGDASSELRNWRIKRDLPMPGSPEITPTWPEPASVCRHISASNALSPARFIIGASGDLARGRTCFRWARAPRRARPRPAPPRP